MSWFQREVQVPAVSKGFHDITQLVVNALPELSKVKVGVLHVFIQHTSASITINENADPDVPHDMDRVLDQVVPEDFPYRHTIEGPEDMPGHVKASLIGSSLSIPIGGGRLKLGTWQGIMLVEHRFNAGRRQLVLTVYGNS